MGRKVKAVAAETALTRVLEALKQELMDASDEELREAARELGMNLEMRESGAFASVTYPARPQLSDFFEFEACRQVQLAVERDETRQSRRAEQSRRKRARKAR
jgi:hypothetical protein